MDLEARVTELSKVAREHREVLLTEEAAKTALVMPFLQALGYNVFNPSEVVPEFTCDVGIKKGEKVDYAVLKDAKPIILFECKHHKADLSKEHASQLYRYFSVTEVAQTLRRSLEFVFLGLILVTATLAVTVNSIAPSSSDMVRNYLAFGAGTTLFLGLLVVYAKNGVLRTMHVYTCAACRKIGVSLPKTPNDLCRPHWLSTFTSLPIRGATCVPAPDGRSSQGC